MKPMPEMTFKKGDMVEIQEFPNVWYRAVVEEPQYKAEFGPLSGVGTLVTVFEKIQFSGGLMQRLIFYKENIRPLNTKTASRNIS